MKGTGQLFINGEWIPGAGDELLSTNPATEEEIWRGREATPTEVNQAISAAKNAFEIWGQLPIEKRIEDLERYVAILRDDQEELAQLLSIEMGKPLWEAKTEVTSALNKLPISIESYHDRCKSLESRSSRERQHVIHRPHGVLAIFAPFNFPIHLPHGHMFPALLAGNTIVLKPSEQTPAIAEHFFHCLERAALPHGVVNLIQGAGSVGQVLSQHPGLNGLLFTGSYVVGQKLADHFAKHPGRVLALELGGNNPLIVHHVSDLSAAQYYTIQSAYITSGQRCTCARRLILPQGENNERFLEGLITKIKRIRVGVATDHPEPFMGPVISRKAADQIFSAYESLIKKGAKPLVPLNRVDPVHALLTPALLDVTGIERKDEEIFGPLLQLIRVKDFEEALKIANETSYGLSAGILTDEFELYQRASQVLRTGTLSWNRATTGSSSKLPFGGIGKSGNFHPTAYYAADYASYPMSCMEYETLKVPDQLTPGIEL